MTNLTLSMRLKVKRDTFFLPDSNKGVYFRNNLSSFLMEGDSIDMWIEKLMPMFNGKYTLGDITDGLQGPYRNRVYEIAEVLYQNGFIRDISQDRPHQLEEHVLKKYASQIEFLDSYGNSGAYRFQTFRQAKVLAIGSGPFFVSLVSALIHSGLPKIDMLITETVPTNRRRLMEIVEHFSTENIDAEIKEITYLKEGENNWREIVKPFDSIMYVSQEGNIEELAALHDVCKQEKKLLIPAIYFKQVGMAGPLVGPDHDGCWDSAWRRIHQSVFLNQQSHHYSASAGAMLANVIVFELFKEMTGCTELNQKNQFYLLDLETLEGSWHSFVSHPMVTGKMTAKWINDFNPFQERTSSKDQANELLLFFSQLTSAESGIFHIWEEGDLIQLPLAQCRVQATDLLTEGPSELLPIIDCTGLTHEEARREAGLQGIESYLSRTVDLLVPTLPPLQESVYLVEGQECMSAGAGETLAEGVIRGLQRCLEEELSKQVDRKHFVSVVQLNKVEDERCRFYLEALSTMQGAPIIGSGEGIFGLPVVWVRTNDGWYRSVGLNTTIALRKALQQAIMNVQNQADGTSKQGLEFTNVLLNEDMPLSLTIHQDDESTQLEALQSAMQVLEQNHKKLLLFEIAQEQFLEEKLAVVGVLIREVESR
ncbi:putative thiazole-containing bacteriocin maturation protein [Cytobacillus purgationiresistens]|uniref:Thiazole-containing bacteriocin maturation protein n=1 Tax=Cytobacillus purgationiresistens TaxID=863449 RepID=A0ABU0ACI4_9BACI|nr:putative thiazole-containing bacteriocin maturation protein [Cytobacillus purgationiresistens]MDQ0268594.1 putative thiazole-containing bacteriocin maturation protein [Cytobacillus purgationiresistens]